MVVIPNDLLLYLPIHALMRDGPDGSLRFLSETHVISYLTQLELADLVNPFAPSANAALLAVANPDGTLPAASREIRELGKIRSSVTTLDGPQATKERFLSLAGKFPDLHLATHGILDPERPENSYLLMAGADESSRHMTIGEIAGLRLQPNGLAILSACETAVGEQVPGAALITCPMRELLKEGIRPTIAIGTIGHPVSIASLAVPVLATFSPPSRDRVPSGNMPIVSP